MGADCPEKNCQCSGGRKLVGKVTTRERDEIQGLFERKNGLTELIHSLAASGDELIENSHFYEKIIADLGRTTTKHQQWWDQRARQYQWENIAGCVWEIDFDSCNIFIRPK